MLGTGVHSPEDRRFVGLASGVLDDILVRDPVHATRIGDHRFDGRLPDLTHDGTTEFARVLLRQHRLRRREQALALGVRLADDALLFSNAEGRPWRPDVCTNRFGRLRGRLGLEHVRLHDLRHFVASVLIDGGIAISTVAARLGHSQISTTLIVRSSGIRL